MKKSRMILRSDAVFTSTGDDPFSGCVEISGNRIVGVYRRDEPKYREIMREAACSAQNTGIDYYDFGHRLIMPGFVDAHVHFFIGAISASEYICTEIGASKSEAECVEILRHFADAHPEQNRLIGLGWFPANWSGAPLPTKKSLDEAFPHTPVYLIAADVHTFWMNSKALEEAGIDANSRLKSGKIGVFKDGELNGLLHEPEAFAPAMAKVIEFNAPEMRKIHRDSLAMFARYGITSISEMSADDYDAVSLAKYRTLKELEEKDMLTARIHFYLKLEGYTDFTAALKSKSEYQSGKLKMSGVKGFIDGVTSTYTAYMLDPYADKPNATGILAPLNPKEETEASIIAANKAGLGVRLHCIGDAAVKMALDMYETSNKVNCNAHIVNTIEHIESISPSDIPRFAELGVVPSMQPAHLPLDAFEKITRIGMMRSRYEWPHRSLIEDSASLAFGTDYPVVEANPFESLFAAVYRKNHDGTDASVNPEERITLKDALIAYTAGGANAYNRLHELGTLEKGKLADIIVVDRNLFDVGAESLRDASVAITVMDGNIVYADPLWNLP
jgi:predicted amidohydrolase YtcJ